MSPNCFSNSEQYRVALVVCIVRKPGSVMKLHSAIFTSGDNHDHSGSKGIFFLLLKDTHISCLTEPQHGYV